MPRKTPGEPSLEQVVGEIRRIRLQRFFSFSDRELESLCSKHESLVHVLYEICYRYGDMMDDKMKSAVAIYLLSEGAELGEIHKRLNEDGSNRNEVLSFFRGKRKSSAYN